MSFENFLEMTTDGVRTKKGYLSALNKFMTFIKEDKFIHGGSSLSEVRGMLKKESNWKYNENENEITDYKEGLINRYPYLNGITQIDELKIENLEELKNKMNSKGDLLFRAISRADGNGALSAVFGKFIDYKSLSQQIDKDHKLENDTKEYKEKKLAKNRIIYGAPGTGKSYKLEQESLVFKRLTKEEKVKEEEHQEIKYWIATCGRDNTSWNDFKENSIYAVGWDELEDLKQYSTKNDMKQEVEKLAGKQKQVENQWNISRLMKKGDIIAIRSGIKEKKIVAYGIVDGNYEFIKERELYKQTIPVNWIEERESILNTYNKQFPMHSLTEMNGDLKLAFKEEYFKEEVCHEYEIKDVSTVERVTFYDGYTNGQFVGTYKPFPVDNGITYEYIEGPFMKQLVEAYRNCKVDYCLIIEEINRARADKVFGNIFQLLDRNTNGNSEYRIAASRDQILYLKEKLKEEYSEVYNDILTKGLYIPENFYIWATMNSADQGVYPLDSAFKRRWSFEHIGLDDNAEKFGDEKCKYKVIYQETKEEHLSIEWNDFREVINDVLLNAGVNEDRLIAPFFIKPKDFEKENEIVYTLSDSVLLDKILMYLFEDVLRHKKKTILFKEELKNFSKLKKEFNADYDINKEINSVFNKDVLNKLDQKVNPKFKAKDEE